MRIAALLVALALASAALAGGDFVDAAAGDASVWVVGGFGVRELSAGTGAVLFDPQPASASIPISVAVAGGAVWVASIENGFVDGRVTRIDLRTHASRIVWHRPNGSAQYVAPGAGGVYVLLGSARGNRVIRIGVDGRVTGSWSVGDGGRVAADAAGCWISSSRGLLHIDRRGRLRVALRAPFGDIAAGDGAVWLGLAGAVLRLDERTGRVTRIHTARLRLGGFQHDIAAGDGALWTLQRGSGATTLQRRDPHTGAVRRSAPIVGLADAIALLPAAVWVATATAVDRFDPVTLRRTLSVPLI